MTHPTQDILLPEKDALEEAPAAKAVSPRTRARWEAAGRFPRRKHITAKTFGYSQREIAEWNADPEAWAARHQTSGEEAA